MAADKLLDELTEQQRRAVRSSGQSISLSAGAGCGKTLVLTERLLEELRFETSAARSTPIDEMVAITFTDKAAREMRDRVRRKIRERVLQSTSASERNYWQGVLRDIGAARISTIHAFCGALIRSHAVEAGLDPAVQVLEAAQAHTVLGETIDDVLRQKLTDQDGSVMDLVFQYGLNGARSMAAALMGARTSAAWDEWLLLSPAELAERWDAFRREKAIPLALDRFAASEAFLTIQHSLGEVAFTNKTMKARRDVLLETLPMVQQGTATERELKLIKESARVQNSGGKKTWPSGGFYEEFKQAAEKLRKLCDDAQSVFVWNSSAAENAAQLGLDALSLARDVAAAYQLRKQELAVLDFDDLLTAAHHLLTGESGERLRQSISSQIRLLLVDEFQDTDPLQVQIVHALCGGAVDNGKLFFVGDYKQSIYRFRGARPDVFLDLQQEVPVAGRLQLSVNFRSQPAILKFVNALFTGEFVQDYQPLVPSRPQVSPEPCVELMWYEAQGPSRTKGAKELARKGEADWIAKWLRNKLDNGQPMVWDEEAAGQGAPAPRAPRQGDFALLFRALSDVQVYEEALQRHGIEYYLVGGHAFYAQQEIFDLLNVLRSIADPSDDVSLAGALRSPFFSLSDESIFWLAAHNSSLSYGFGATSLPEHVDSGQRERVEFARRVINELREIKDRVPIADLIERLLSQTGFDAVVLTEYLGERKLANVQKLRDQARTMDRAGIFGLDDFIFQVAQFVAAEPREPLAATHGEDLDVVRLMTIHQAKGLEFPVVIVPDLDRSSFHRLAPAVLHEKLGPLVRPAADDAKESSGYQLFSRINKFEEQEEATRLLYVATTRAADHLLLSSSRFRGEGPGSEWTKHLARHLDLQTGEWKLDLPDEWAVPQVKVVLSEPECKKKSAKKPRFNTADIIASSRELQGRGELPETVRRIPVDDKARRSFSFSRLSGLIEAYSLFEEVPDDDLPRTSRISAGDASFNPLVFGGLIHVILEQIEFSALPDLGAIWNRVAPCFSPTAEAMFPEAAELVARFLETSLAKTLAESTQIHREMEFVMSWPPGNSDKNAVRLEGFIDCLYQDRDLNWHILDYKTNRVTENDVPSVAKNYRMQMLLYGMAVEEILKNPPASLTLYFLRPGVKHQFQYSRAACAEATDQIDKTLEVFRGGNSGAKAR